MPTTTAGRSNPAQFNAFMPTQILRILLAIIVMIVAGALPQRAPHHFSTSADSTGTANIVLADTSASSPSLPFITPHASANQLTVTGPTFSEPLLLLLMGTLLIAVGTGIRRLTKSRRPTRAAVPRQT